jgi:hypothetical protein
MYVQLSCLLRSGTYSQQVGHEVEGGIQRIGRRLMKKINFDGSSGSFFASGRERVSCGRIKSVGSHRTVASTSWALASF